MTCNDCKEFDGEDEPAEFRCRSCGILACDFHAYDELAVMCCEFQEMEPVSEALPKGGGK